jgi:hypothetical protein
LLAGARERVLVQGVFSSNGRGSSGCGCSHGEHIAIDEEDRTVIYPVAREDGTELMVWSADSRKSAPLAVRPSRASDSNPTVSRKGGIAWLRKLDDQTSIVYRRRLNDSADWLLLTDSDPKDELAFLSTAPLLSWHHTDARTAVGDGRGDEILLGDVEQGIFQALGPRADGGQTFTISPDAKMTATLSPGDRACKRCALLGRFHNHLVRVFEVAGRRQVVSVEGVIETVAFSDDGRQLWLVSPTDVFFLDGRQVPIEPHGGGVYALDIAQRSMRWRMPWSRHGNLRMLANATATFDSDAQTLSLFARDGAEGTRLRNVAGWSVTADGSTLVTLEHRDDGIRLVARSLNEQDHAP